MSEAETKRRREWAIEVAHLAKIKWWYNPEHHNRIKSRMATCVGGDLFGMEDALSALKVCGMPFTEEDIKKYMSEKTLNRLYPSRE